MRGYKAKQIRKLTSFVMQSMFKKKGYYAKDWVRMYRRLKKEYRDGTLLVFLKKLGFVERRSVQHLHKVERGK